MDWTQIILSLITFFGGGGLAMLVTLKSVKRKGETDNYSDLVGVISTMKDELVKTIKEGKAEIQERDNKIEDLQRQLSDKRDETTTKGWYMCVNLGCQLRCPSLGRGKVYFNQHGQEESFGANYLTAEELMCRHKRKVMDWHKPQNDGTIKEIESYEDTDR